MRRNFTLHAARADKGACYDIFSHSLAPLELKPSCGMKPVSSSGWISSGELSG
jgi:hypothetical protein